MSLTYLYRVRFFRPQMLHHVDEQQTVGQLEACGEDMRQKGDTAHDPSPAAIRIKVLQRRRGSFRMKGRMLEKHRNISDRTRSEAVAVAQQFNNWDVSLLQPNHSHPSAMNLRYTALSFANFVPIRGNGSSRVPQWHSSRPLLQTTTTCCGGLLLCWPPPPLQMISIPGEIGEVSSELTFQWISPYSFLHRIPMPHVLFTCRIVLVSTPARRSPGTFRCRRWNSLSSSDGHAESSSSWYRLWDVVPLKAACTGWWEWNSKKKERKEKQERVE